MEKKSQLRDTVLVDSERRFYSSHNIIIFNSWSILCLIQKGEILWSGILMYCHVGPLTLSLFVSLFFSISLLFVSLSLTHYFYISLSLPPSVVPFLGSYLPLNLQR